MDAVSHLLCRGLTEPGPQQRFAPRRACGRRLVPAAATLAPRSEALNPQIVCNEGATAASAAGGLPGRK